MLDSRNTKPVPDHLPEDLFARLERERLDADRLYNDALTEVDRAIRAAPLLPGAPRPFDEARVADLNAAWDILPQGVAGGGPLAQGAAARIHLAADRAAARNAAAVQRGGCGPPEPQCRCRARMAARNRRACSRWSAASSSELARFQSLLVQYLQTITVYVDSKDRSLGGPRARATTRDDGTADAGAEARGRRDG